ncbi:sigma-70 family RNA polymerase sigma factor [Solitalea sp. MAHUQ-68]|uniref:Sigma-70 family RNA polymerase sigma factor n=1 Tax=Solitalea agri TaxID=2953739 RepID=A0A9X2F1U8_9SPHI|nr:sigma-70 family RNA polymerase sigma factor [Solitalea agri]MCO4292635.1 sigma-70 family RNA polymerase sigma factor [Solitalea agri]
MTRIEFNTLVLRQSSSLKLYALHFTKDSDDANDLVQDTLLKAITYYNKFKEGTNLKGWLYTIMKNTFINNYRRLVKVNNVVIQSDDILPANLLYSATSNGAEGKFVLEDVNKALSNLSEEYYTPFTMYFEGYKYHEIAEELSIPIGTVKTRIHVARKLLKGQLKDYSAGRIGKVVYED